MKDKLHLFEGIVYKDDRLFILDLTLSEKDCRTFWVVVTRRNHEGFPPFRYDTFKTREEATRFIKEVEPTAPLISLGGKGPKVPMSYEDYCHELKKKGLPSALDIYEINKDTKREIIIEELGEDDKA